MKLQEVQRAAPPASPPPPSPPPPPPPPPPTTLASVFHRLLENKVLDAISVCELGCTCRQLRDYVRQFWEDAENKPGSHAVWLKEDEDEAGRFVDFGWLARRASFAVFARAGFGGDCGAELRLPASHVLCSCCGELNIVHYYAFDDALDARLCRACWGAVAGGGGSGGGTSSGQGALPPSRAPPEKIAHFRLEPLRKLALMYWMSLPLGLVESCPRSLRPKARKSKPVFELDVPHCSVRRVAAWTLRFGTPRHLRWKWEVIKTARACFRHDPEWLEETSTEEEDDTTTDEETWTGDGEDDWTDEDDHSPYDTE
jgi:hypothetical protein